jgi:hypothetical protein
MGFTKLIQSRHTSSADAMAKARRSVGTTFNLGQECKEKGNHKPMILSRKGIPLKDLSHIYQLSIQQVCDAVADVEKTYLAWGISLPPKIRVKGLTP